MTEQTRVLVNADYRSCQVAIETPIASVGLKSGRFLKS
jgi:hypothetical protein